MTTNCLMRPRDSYKDRIYSTNVVGWEGVKHIGKKENGDKDFSEIIQQAIELGGFKEDVEPHEILVGFGHHATLSYADKLSRPSKAEKSDTFSLLVVVTVQDRAEITTRSLPKMCRKTA